jgi:AcrR family transcriptional regulator
MAGSFQIPTPSSPENTDPTRARLIEAAGQVFAEHGFQSATIREICTRAGANIAAVNYHFRDKAGLYLAVLRHSMTADVGQPDPRQIALNTESPQEALRLIISAMLHRMHSPITGRACHLRIMAHEMAQPTEALPRVVEEVIGPNYAAMRQTLSRILGTAPEDELTRFCAHSVVGQVVHYAHAGPVISLLWPELKMTPDRLNEIAGHIAEFSLAALNNLKRKNSHE